MFEYFGGAAEVLICDNLKTGVIKHPKNGNVVLQKDYQAMADYYQTVIVPDVLENLMTSPLQKIL